MDQSDVSFFLRKRYYVILMLFLGVLLANFLNVTLSICIVKMTSNRTVTIGNKTFNEPAEFEWTASTKAMLLSAFSLGFSVSLVWSILAIKFGGVTVYGFGITTAGLISILSPILIKWNSAAYFAARVLEGAFEGVGPPCATEILRQWTRPEERSRLTAAVFMGYHVGITIGFPVCGIIAHRYDWQAVFYITGIGTLLWSTIWWLFIRNTPETDRMISKEEKQFLQDVTMPEEQNKVVAYPWKQILSSKAVLAYSNGRFIESWSFSFVTTCLPLYLKDAFKESIENIGYLSGIPQLLGMASLLIAAFIADHIRANKTLTITTLHKVYITFTQSMSIILLLSAGYTENYLLSTVCICLYKFCSSFEFMSNILLPMDIGGPFSSVIMGIGTSCAIIGYVLNPIVMSCFVQNHTLSEWNMYFLTLAALNVYSGIIFLRYGSGELQYWAKKSEFVH